MSRLLESKSRLSLLWLGKAVVFFRERLMLVGEMPLLATLRMFKLAKEPSSSCEFVLRAPPAFREAI